MMRALNLLSREIKDKFSHHARIRDDKSTTSKLILRVNIIKSSISIREKERASMKKNKKKKKKYQQGDWNTVAMRLAGFRRDL